MPGPAHLNAGGSRKAAYRSRTGGRVAAGAHERPDRQCATKAAAMIAPPSALEAAGVEFIPENGGGAEVRLREN